MKALFTTYFDKNYLQRGLTLIRSLARHKPDAEIVVLCLDRTTYLLLAKLALPHVTLLQIDAFEKQYPELRNVKDTRSIVEYYWTITPCLILHLLHEQKHGDGVIYLDADQMFFSSPTPIITELRHSSVLIQSHNFPKRLRETHLKYGEYNVGVLGARNNADGAAVISWWKERCLERCSVIPDEKGRFADQKYLESFFTLSQEVAVIKHPGVGIAPWNHENAPCGRDAQGRLMYGKTPVIIYHYHSLVFVSYDFIAPIKSNNIYDFIVPTTNNNAYCLTQEATKEYYTPYLDEIDVSLDILRGVDPDFSFSTALRDIPYGAPFLVRPRLKSVQALNGICMGCRYCDGCPREIPVSYIMKKRNALLFKVDEAYNRTNPMLVQNMQLFRSRIGEWLPETSENPCISCGKCEEKCTQNLNIIEAIDDTFQRAGKVGFSLKSRKERLNELLIGKDFKRVGLYPNGGFANLIVELYNKFFGQPAFEWLQFNSDPKMWGGMSGGLSVYSPDEIRQFRPDIIIICSYKYGVEIYESLRHYEDNGIKIVKLHRETDIPWVF